MNKSVSCFFVGMVLAAHSAAWAQSACKNEVASSTDANVQHLFLTLDVPQANVSVKSSYACGVSKYQVVSQTQNLKIEKVNLAHQANNQSQLLSLRPVASPSASVLPSAEVSDMLIFRPDPNISTDLTVHAPVGKARVQLGDMSLTNVIVKGVSSDIIVDCEQKNRMAMKLLKIKNINGEVVLRNPEKANVQVVNIENDMGDVRVVMGQNTGETITIYIQSVYGNVNLIVNNQQPVKITVRNHIKTEIKLPSNFVQIQPDVYSNEASVSSDANPIHIICDKDMGVIEVLNEK